MAASNLTQTGTDHSAGWDWENQHVNESFKIGASGESANPNPTDIMESGTVLICAAPASISNIMSASSNSSGGNGSFSGINIVPIGMVEQAQVAQSKPLQRIFEIGSKLSYIIPGRVVGQISLSRVMFDGPSLLKCLYQGEVASDAQATDGTKHVKFMTDSSESSAKGFQPIGSGQVAMNLASTFFDQSVGLVFFFKDRQNDNVSTMYFEGCRVSTHSLGIAAGMNVMSESISMEFVRVVPVIVGAKYSVNTKPSDTNQKGKLYDIPIIGGYSVT